MNEHTTKLIEQLAEKLGTTAEHLWAALLRQAPIWAWTKLALWGGLAIAIVGLFYWGRRLLDKDDSSEWDEGFGIVCLAFSGICLICLIVEVCQSVPLLLACFFNPEYWAFKQILP